MDDKYASVPFPYPEQVQRLVVPYHVPMTIATYVNYLNTWSALQKYKQDFPNNDILAQFKQDLIQVLQAKSDQDELLVKWNMYAVVTVKK